MSSAADANAAGEQADQDADDSAAPAEIDAPDVAAVDGTVSEEATLNLQLKDGRVLVTRVAEIRTGPHHCPEGDCFQRFDSKQGLRIHRSKTHKDAEAGRERTCPTCGETFVKAPSQDDTYCSWECYTDSRWTTSTCAICGGEFEYRRTRDASYCSNTCRFEGMRSDPRPTDIHCLLYELYVEDDFDRETTAKRARANLGHDSEWSLEELRAEIDTARIQVGLDLPDHVTAERVREIVDDAGTVFEVERELRISYQRTRNLLSRLGLLDELDTDEDDVLAAARANLGLDEDGNPIDQPDSEAETDWMAYSGRGGGSQ